MGVNTETRQLSETINAIYDCVLEPRNWPRAIRAVAAEMDSSCGMLCRASPSLGTVQALHHWGMNSDSFREMASGWGDQLTGRSSIANAPVLEPFGLEYVREVTNTEDFWQQPFFTDWFRPRGFGDAATLVLYRTQHRALTFSMITRSTEPHVSPQHLNKLGLLAPHLQRAIMLGEHIDRQHLALSRFERLLDSMTHAIVILDQSGRVSHANVAANAMLAKGDALRVHGGKLELVGMATETTRLNELIQSLAHRSGLSKVESLPIQLNLGAPAVAYVVPLAHTKPHLIAHTDSSVAIMICTDRSIDAPVQALASLYGLTEAEQRVLSHIAQGKNRAQTADALSVADSTVKSHLNRIFEKTGMASQSELVQCFTRLTAPLAI